MRFKMNLTAVAAFAAITFLGGPTAQADLYIWLGVDPEAGWCESTNWLNVNDPLNGYPQTADDKVIISGDCIAPCEDITIGELVIRDDAGVFIEDGITLTITDSGSRNGRLTIERWPNLNSCKGKIRIYATGTLELAGDQVAHRIGGDIELRTSTSILLISADVILDPNGPSSDRTYGHVRGYDNNAQIRICEGYTLTNNIIVEGQMTIRSVSCGASSDGDAPDPDDRAAADDKKNEPESPAT